MSTKRTKKVKTVVETITVSFKQMFSNVSQSVYDRVKLPGGMVHPDELVSLHAPFHFPTDTKAVLAAAGGAKALLGKQYDQAVLLAKHGIPFVVVVTHVANGQEFIYAMIPSIDIVL